jgi:8-oxo-dGTP diphosphatase
MSDSPFEHYQPGLSIDSVIFGFHQNTLKVLLMKLKNLDDWSLPGGFVNKDENLDDAAVRILNERTGLDKIFLHQFKAFGKVDRAPNDHAKQFLKHNKLDGNWEVWFNSRFITIGYYALVDFNKVRAPQPDFTSDSCQWHPLENLPSMMIDHRDIIVTAYEELKKNLSHQPVGVNLLPRRFTMPELQSLYETILGKKLDRRNFQRKMLSFDILIKTSERRTGGSHKAPVLYQFDKNKYEEALSHGLRGSW